MRGEQDGGENGGKKARIYYDDYSSIALVILNVMRGVQAGGGGRMEVKRLEYIMMITQQ